MDTSRVKALLLRYPLVIELLLVTLVTIPAFASLLNGSWFTHHDDQHVARLYQFAHAFREGTIYPRWVDGFGFGYGYPLFNFYPPFIYFVAMVFHLTGFSLTWSIKFMLFTGFLAGAFGMYLFTRELYGRVAALVSSTLYTYFLYHGVLVYVRGAFAEFFAMAVLPFLFWTIIRLQKKPTITRSLAVALAFGILIVSHPLIAFPAVFYLALYGLYFILRTPPVLRGKLIVLSGIAAILGLAVSAFFWLPSMTERGATYVDELLTTELADYAIHFVQPAQLYSSVWGYGGSGPGLEDGMTFQLGKIHIGLAVLAAMIVSVLLVTQRRKQERDAFAALTILLAAGSIFMTVETSKPVWDAVSFLHYLQFPWRFLTFAAVFLSLAGGIAVSFMEEAIEAINNSVFRSVFFLIVCGVVLASVAIYGRYFEPKNFTAQTDAELTSRDEITWRVSRTSFEFVPKGIITRKSELGTTILDLDPDDRPDSSYELILGRALVEESELTASRKRFIVKAGQPVVFRLNTFNFPGWRAYRVNPVENTVSELPIRDDNPYKLITLDLPPGEYILTIVFEDTPVRLAGNVITLSGVGAGIMLFIRRRQGDKVLGRLFSFR